MDHREFDRLARLIAVGQNRRRVFKTLAAVALAAVAGARGVDAATRKRSVGNACATNADCASNLCVTEARTRKICACVSPADCPQATDQCHVAVCTFGVCGNAIAVGQSCDDGNPCTTESTCDDAAQCGKGTPTANGVTCAGGVCCDGACQVSCNPYGDSACQTPTTTCDANIVTCSGNSCWAFPTTSGLCACGSSPARLHNACAINDDCVGAARCDIGSRRCVGDFDIACAVDGDCSSLSVCQNGACGGQICLTDADCAARFGASSFCVSGAALPCTGNGANVCWTLCPGS
jgi:hypothetical protein